MSEVVQQTVIADSSSVPALPMRKRKKPEDEGETFDKDDESVEAEEQGDAKRPALSKAREVRLEQNRKAARESRRRKKVMIEELQRSVIFFSRANGTLKQQNDELTRMLMNAQSQVAAVESNVSQQKLAQQQPQAQQQTQPASHPGASIAVSAPSPAAPPVAAPAPATVSSSTAPVKVEEGASKADVTQQGSQQQQQQQGTLFQQAQAQVVATQALYETQGFPAAAARAAAQIGAAPGVTLGSSANQTQNHMPQLQQKLPSMQPGATMQAMANFQQAAAAAMQAAMQGMQGVPGVNMNALAPTPMGANAQQVYTDTMTAFAMQQAAAAAAGQHFAMFQPGAHFMAHHPMMAAWQQAQASVPISVQPQAPVMQNVDKSSQQTAQTTA